MIKKSTSPLRLPGREEVENVLSRRVGFVHKKNITTPVGPPKRLKVPRFANNYFIRFVDQAATDGKSGRFDSLKTAP
jgi:hypothetical protein